VIGARGFNVEGVSASELHDLRVEWHLHSPVAGFLATAYPEASPCGLMATETHIQFPRGLSSPRS